ncbi:MAG TPA: LamG-like jellyroll fold domain-containing protein [Pirellulales bacterium]|nr:LamG-like jellyroll fold domain-containing protein [Pirellulales bacterium]
MSDASDIIRRFIEDRDGLSDEEMASLVATLRASPQLAAELKEQLLIDDLLAQQLDLTRWRFLAQVDQRIRDLGDPQEGAAGVLPWTAEMASGRRPARRWAVRWLVRWASLAAGILLGLGVVAGYWAFDRFAGHVAVLEKAGDRVTLVRGGKGRPAEAAAALCAGDRLLTGPESAAAVRYRDGTLVEIEGAASVDFRRSAGGAGKTIWIERGSLSAQVAPQPRGEPMLFDSRGATTRVLGTSLRVHVAGDETRVQVREGRVQLTRKSDGKALTVAGGEFAVAAPQTFMAAPIAWPSSRQGLLFLFETNDKPNLVRSSTTGVNRSYSVRPRGDAHLNHDCAMVLTGGAFLAEDADGEILTACRQTNELTIEATVRPSLAEQQGPARIVTFSTDVVNRDFTLGQLGDQLIIRIRTPQTGPNGVGGVEPGLALGKLTVGEPNHVIVSYRPGRIACYLNGKQVFEGDQIEGDFRDWSAQHLLFGDEYGGERNWAGTLEGVAIYNRFMSADEAERNALEYEDLRKSRRVPPQLRVLAELVAKSKIPTSEQILPHRSALAVSKYRVKQLLEGELAGGESAGGEIFVAQWAVLDARKQPIVDLAPGAEAELLLEPFDRNPQIQRYLCSDDFQPDEGGRRFFEVRR